MITNLFGRHLGDALRRIRGHKYDFVEDGIHLPGYGNIAGFFEVQHGDGPWEVAPNLVVTEGRNHILGVALAQSVQKLAFYIAPFSGDVTPNASWTGATFTANATEITTGYDEANRVVWAKGAVSAGSVSNTLTPAVFTFNSTVTARGAGLLEASGKAATTGVLIAAARFPSDKPMADDEELRIKYTITLTSV